MTHPIKTLNEPAQRVIIMAGEQARLFRHDFVGPEHLLLGVILEADHLGPLTETVKTAVEQALAAFTKTLTAGDIPLNAEAAQVLDLAGREADRLGYQQITPHHIYLGIRGGESIAARILKEVAL